MEKLLTITLVAYNEEKHISETIKSLLKQTFKDFKLLIYNHGSTDTTGLIAETFAEIDNRVKVINLPNNEPKKINTLIFENIETPFYMFAAGHDLYHPHYIEKCIAPLIEDQNIVLSYSRSAFFKDSNFTGQIPGNFNTQGTDPLSRSLVVGYSLVYAYQWYGIYRTSIRKSISHQSVVGADHVLLSELAMFGTFAECTETLFFMRQLGDFGNQEAYKNKHHAKDNQDGHDHFLRTARAYMRIANYQQNEIDKNLLKIAYFTQALIRNRNILDMYGCSVETLLSMPQMESVGEKISDLVRLIEHTTDQAEARAEKNKTIESLKNLPSKDQSMSPTRYSIGSLAEIEHLQIHAIDYARHFFSEWSGEIDAIRFEHTRIGENNLFCTDLILRKNENSFIVFSAYLKDECLVLPSALAAAGNEQLTKLQNVISEQLAASPKQYEPIALSRQARINLQVARNGRALPGVCDYTTATNHLRRYLFLNQIGISGSVLECAAGTGYGAAILTRNSAIENYLGIDLDTEAITIARGMVNDMRFDFQSEALSSIDGKFDYVLSLETIEHVDNPYTFVKELQGKLKPDGTLIASIPAERWAGNHLNPSHLTNWTYQRFQRFFEAHFEEVEIHLQQLSLLGPSPLESAHIFRRPFQEARDEDFIVIARRPKAFCVKTIVVKRTNALGDVLWMTPILAELRQRNPDACIVAVTRHTDALMRNPDIDLVATPDFRAKAEDQIINLDGAYEERRKHHLLAAYAEVSGISPSRPDPVFLPYPDDRDRVVNFIQNHFQNSGVRTLIAIHAGATSPDRIWPKEHWYALLERLLQQPHIGVLLIGHNHDYDSAEIGIGQHPRILDLVRQLNLSLAGAALAHCDLLVCVDSGMLHLATAVGTPSIAMFGMALAETRLPFITLAKGIQSAAECSGCLVMLPAEAIPICKFGRGKSTCMDMIYPDQIIEAVTHFVSASSGNPKFERLYTLSRSSQNSNTQSRKSPLDEAISEFHKNNLDEATKAFADLLKKLPENPLPLAYLAFICALRGLTDDAEVLINKAMELDSEHFEFKAELGKNFLKAGQPTLAEKYLQEAINKQPDLFAYYPSLAEAMRQNGEADRAILFLESSATIPSPAQDEILGTLLTWLSRASNITAIVKLCSRLRRHSAYQSLGLALAPRTGLSATRLAESVQSLLADYPKFVTAPIQANTPLTIAFLASDYQRERISGRLENLLRHLPTDRFRTIIYWNDARQESETIQQSPTSSDKVTIIAQCDDATALQDIAANNVQILIDMDGLGIQHRLPLFLAAPVPVKLSWSDTALPLLAGIPCLHGEALCLEGDSLSAALHPLPGLGEYLDFPDFSIEPHDASQPFTFACLCSPTHYDEDSWQSFARLLAQTPASRILINQGELGPDAQSFIAGHFLREGVERSRLDFIHANTPDTIAAAWNQANLGLAPLHGPGDIALPLGLWMEKTYLAAAGNAPWSRRPATLLRTLGQDNCIADTADGLLKIFDQITKDVIPAGCFGLRDKMKERGIVRNAETLALTFTKIIDQQVKTATPLGFTKNP